MDTRSPSEEALVASYERALESLEKNDLRSLAQEGLTLMRESPNDPRSRHIAGLLALQKGDADKAVEHLEAAVTLESREPRLWYDLSHAYHAQGQEARSESATELASAAEVIRFVDSFPYLNTDELQAIIQDCEAELAEEPDSVSTFYILTHALLALDSPLSEPLPELSARLEHIGWEYKEALYTYWIRELHLANHSSPPEAEVIILATRASEELASTLERLRAEPAPRTSITLVSNNPHDEALRELAGKVDQYIENTGNAGAYAARNIGAAFSDAPVLIFLEDDGIPEPGLVGEHLAVHKSRHPWTVRGRARPFPPDQFTPAHYDLGEQLDSSPLNLEGNASVDRALFLQVGGWGDYILFGLGGPELTLRLLQLDRDRNRFLYTPGALLWHDWDKGSEQAMERKALRQKASNLLIRARTGEPPAYVRANWDDLTSPGPSTASTSAKGEALPSPLVTISIPAPGGTSREFQIPERETHRFKALFKGEEYSLPAGYRLPDDGVVLDVGANFGLFAAYAHLWNPRATIHAFEPNPRVFPVLEENMAAIDRGHCHPVALAGNDGEAPLYLHPRNTGQASTSHWQQGETESITLRDAASAIDEIGMQRIDVLKIDTEGAEVAILHSLQPARRGIAIVMAEYHCEQDRRLIDTLLPGFRLYSCSVVDNRGIGTVKYFNERLLETR